ncbi:hypothetical protein CC86DRAFT_410891 [Ophiobolus disseminans]|uniref:F-box domain-containing protein n=1 Tax=Ophiobolus disseminans TaxID=1469910 RepID=A0A6A6ZL36_9PLEO|nr:hypothetical protein CC86DRAFT_410891 [Ophiobolus disseminans]
MTDLSHNSRATNTTAISSSSPSTFPKFLSLPLELKDLIYTHYLATESRYTMPTPLGHWPAIKVTSKFPLLPSLALTSRELRTQVSRVLLRSATKIVLTDLHAVAYFLSFLSSFDNYDWPFELVLGLVFEDLEKPVAAGNRIVGLMKRCGNLQELELCFRLVRLRGMSVEQRVDEYRLSCVLQCTALRRVSLVGYEPQRDEGIRRAVFTFTAIPGSMIQHHAVARFDEDDLDVLTELSGWMEEEFKKKGQAVDVGVTTRACTGVGPVPERRIIITVNTC